MKKAIIYSALFMMFAAPCSAQPKWLKSLAKGAEKVLNAASTSTSSSTSTSRSTSSSLKNSGSEEVLQYSMETVPVYTAPREQQMRIVTNNPNLKVRITRCVASGKTVLLDLVFTNVSGNDAEGIFVVESSRSNGRKVYDDQGNSYSSVFKSANNDFRDRSWMTLLADVPVKATLRIENVSTNAEMLARVTIPLEHNGLGLELDTPVTLRNIPISRDE